MERIASYNKSRAQAPESKPSPTMKSPSKCAEMPSPVKDCPSTNQQEDVVPSADSSPERVASIASNEDKVRFRNALAEYEKNRRGLRKQPERPLTAAIVHQQLLNKIKEYDKKRRQTMEVDSSGPATEKEVASASENEPDKVIIVEMEIDPSPPPDLLGISAVDTSQRNALLDRIAAYQRNFKSKNPEPLPQPVYSVAEDKPKSLMDRISCYHMKLRDSSSGIDDISLVQQEVNIAPDDQPVVDRQSLLRARVSRYEMNRKSYSGQSIPQTESPYVDSYEAYLDCSSGTSNQGALDDFVLIEGPDGGYEVNARDMMSCSVPVRIFE